TTPRGERRSPPPSTSAPSRSPTPTSDSERRGRAPRRRATKRHEEPVRCGVLGAAHHTCGKEPSMNAPRIAAVLAASLGFSSVGRLATAQVPIDVSVASSGTQGNGPSTSASLSADGRYAVFESPADNLVAGDTNAAWDIFVRDRATGSTEIVSVDSSG